MDFKEFETIPGSDTWVSVEKINKGFSGEDKYLVIDNNNQKYLLRIASIDSYDERKKQYDLLKEIEKLNINASKAVCIGKLNESKMYTVLTYLNGCDAGDVIKNLSNKDAYNLGYQTGVILAKLHTLKVDTSTEGKWIDKFKAKMLRKYKALEECELEIEHIDIVKEFVENNYHLLENRPLTFTHGDFHVNNLIVDNNEIGVIDFEKNKISDPYDDLKPFVWNVFVSEYFQTGLINGYFLDNIPSDFFPILKMYAAENFISFLPWAYKVGGETLTNAYKINTSLMEWYDKFNLVVPTFYKGVIKEWKN